MTEIIQAKVHHPAPTGLVRPRLKAPLEVGSGPGVVMVIAPPGSGKTTLLALVSAETRFSAWCTAGPEDRSGPGFLCHVARAMSLALGTDLGRPITAASLIDRLDTATTPPMLLVIDDVHELIGGSAEAQLTELLRWRPPGLKIALGTRRQPAVNTPRLLVSGELAELNPEALRFRSWEVEELFRRVYRQPLSPEAAATLTRHTGGWAAGLKLFQLSTAGKPPAERERAVTELGGRSKLLRSYLTRTVLDELDPERREFLLLTSTLGTLTGSLCDALLNRRASAAILEDLASEQFFTVASEDGKSYRYHQVMQTHLEGLLVDELGAGPAMDVYANSAQLLEANGRLTDAARAYALAEDYASVARLVQCAGKDLVLGRAASSAPNDDPWLVLARARQLQRMGELERSVATFREAETLLMDADFRHRCVEERAAVALWLPDGGQGPVLPLMGRTVRSIAEVVRRATIRLNSPGPTPLPPLAEALRLMLAGDPTQARTLLASVRSASAAERLVTELATLVAEVADGSGFDVVNRLEQIVLGADFEDQHWLARLARGLQASALLSADFENWRAESCALLVDECRRGGDDWGAMLLSICLGASLATRGDPAAEERLRQAVALATKLNARVIEAWVDTLSAAVARARGESDGPARVERARARSKAAGLYRADTLVERLLLQARNRSAPEVVNEATPLRLRCFGAFAIELTGVPVTLPPLRPLPRNLLLLLAMHHGQYVHREVLIDLLWPDVSVEAATHRLHAAASSVRSCLARASLDQAELRRSGGAYQLHLGETLFDVAEFELALRESARYEAAGNPVAALSWARTALELYRGDLLPEAGPSEWIVQERDRLKHGAAAAAYSVGSLTLRLHSPGDALPALHRAIELDPLRDSAWALLATTQAVMGDVSAAAATRLQHSRVTDQVLNPPSAPRPDVRRAPV
jgi:DNA-binding SARP family transcriptional activator